ncbi:MAG: hypothetical protein H6R27_1132 [Proteobacteria bacterium]|nr:hypothetical protein [Pseudomonadota bacterium]
MTKVQGWEFWALVPAALALVLGGCAGTSGMPRPEVVAGADWSGLEPVHMKGVDIAHVRRGVDFGAYDKVLLEPIEVEFAPDWELLRPASRFPVSERDLEGLRKDVAEPLRDSLVRYIGRGGNYPLVEDPGPGVVRLRLRIVDVRLNAPNLEASSRSEEWARSAGEMTLVAELIDAETGVLLGRVIDRWIDPDGPLERYTWVENDLAIGRAAEDWAEAIRRHLEVASIRNRMHGAGEGLKKADPD